MTDSPNHPDTTALSSLRDLPACEVMQLSETEQRMFDRGYQVGYDAATEHAACVIERIARERGWTAARTLGVIGTLAAAIRNLSP